MDLTKWKEFLFEAVTSGVNLVVKAVEFKFLLLRNRAQFKQITRVNHVHLVHMSTQNDKEIHWRLSRAGFFIEMTDTL